MGHRNAAAQNRDTKRRSNKILDDKPCEQSVIVNITSLSRACYNHAFGVPYTNPDSFSMNICGPRPLPIRDQGYIEHRDRLLKFAADNSGAKQKVTLCTFFF